MQDQRRAGHAGIVVKHRAGCAAREAGACNCRPTYQASVWSAREQRRIRKHFPTLPAAKAWRQDAQVGLRRGTMKAPSAKTLNQAAHAWLEGARDGSIRNRSGDRYKPSALRSYETSLRLRILPDLGAVKLSALSRADVQRLVGRMLAADLNASTIRNAVMPLRAIYRHALAHGDVAVNPTTDLQLPAVRGKRERIATPNEAAALIAALPIEERALWATAMYAGLRAGELRALRWEDIDLAGGVIRVERSWDAREDVVDPKSKAGRRKVPVPAVLRDELVEHRMRRGSAEGLVPRGDHQRRERVATLVEPDVGEPGGPPRSPCAVGQRQGALDIHGTPRSRSRSTATATSSPAPRTKRQNSSTRTWSARLEASDSPP